MSCQTTFGCYPAVISVHTWKGCWLSSSLIRFSNVSIVLRVRSRIARWASRSFARFFANWSGVKFATPLLPGAPLARRFRPFAVVLFGVGLCS